VGHSVIVMDIVVDDGEALFCYYQVGFAIAIRDDQPANVPMDLFQASLPDFQVF